MAPARQLATLVYVRSAGRTLMLHRVKKANDMHAGRWNGLGGKLEAGETPEECAIREVYEESGLRIEAPSLRGVITFPQFSQGVDWYTFVFVATEFRGELIDSAEGELAWVPNAELARLHVWEGDRIFLEWLERPEFFSAKFAYQAGRLADYSVVFYTRMTGPDGVIEAQANEAQVFPAAEAALEPASHGYRPIDDTYCWVCGAAATKRHCKIVCQVCGFTRDCSDP